MVDDLRKDTSGMILPPNYLRKLIDASKKALGQL